jgi:hypothetical protein
MDAVYATCPSCGDWVNIFTHDKTCPSIIGFPINEEFISSDYFNALVELNIKHNFDQIKVLKCS